MFSVSEQVCSFICVFGEHVGYSGKKKFTLSKTREKIEILTDAIFQSLIKWSSDRDFVPEAEQ